MLAKRRRAASVKGLKLVKLDVPSLPYYHVVCSGWLAGCANLRALVFEMMFFSLFSFVILFLVLRRVGLDDC